VNPKTNKIYVTDGSGVTVIDGADNSTFRITTNLVSPGDLAVNKTTNKIYVVNPPNMNGPSPVTIINGANNTTTTVTDSKTVDPESVAVNETTNRVYVVNAGDAVFGGPPGSVTVIDGATNAIIARIIDPNAAESVPSRAAVNPVTNKIYVINGNSFANVTVIDGATNAVVTTIADPTPGGPTYIAVNQVTNKIYVVHVGRVISDRGGITVIDGATNTATAIADPHAVNPVRVAVNPHTNKIYVTNEGALGFGPYKGNKGNVTVIDGATNALTTVTDPNATEPGGLAIDVTTNKIYVDNQGAGGNFTIIDGATHLTTTVDDLNANGPGPIGVNAATNRVYIGHGESVTVMQGAIRGPVSLVLDTVDELFGLFTVGTANAVESLVKVTNIGTSPLVFNSIMLMGTNTTDFAIDNKCGASLAPGKNCTLGVTFRPTAEGVRAASISIADNALDSPQSVVITGQGTFFSPMPAESYDFGSVPVGTSSASKSFTLTNVGPTVMTISRIQTSRSVFTQTNDCGTSLQPGASCTVTVVFTPQTTGLSRATLNVADSAFPLKQMPVNLRGTGI
jgi:DNA-binding beta-propeller fold protein YncE